MKDCCLTIEKTAWGNASDCWENRVRLAIRAKSRVAGGIGASLRQELQMKKFTEDLLGGFSHSFANFRWAVHVSWDWCIPYNSTHCWTGMKSLRILAGPAREH